MLATRGRLRQLLGGLITLLGLAVAVGGGYGLVADLGAEAHRQWPALCLLGGLVAAGGGLLTARRGGGWPAMGARYERTARTDAAGRAGPADRRPGQPAAWDALDRGEDPTVS